MSFKQFFLLFLCLISMTSSLKGEQPDKKWSILILTMEKRQPVFEKIFQKLTKQIEENGLQDKVEILVFKDNGENTIGKKRNHLLQTSKGEYICYVDDDDDVEDNYISLIYNKLEQEKPDCVSLVGIITFNGQNPRTFIHSIKYDSYFEKDNVYYRPPNHLNPIKRDIAIQFKFPENSFGEDTDWAMQIARSGLLKKEAVVDTPYYFYLYVDK